MWVLISHRGDHRGFVQVRAHGSAALACTYRFDGTHLVADLDQPLLGLATGQAMVIYDGDRVVGSAQSVRLLHE